MVRIIKHYQLLQKNQEEPAKAAVIEKPITEEIKVQAYQEGFAEGLKQGQEKGLALAQEETDKRLKKLDELLLSVEQQIAETLRKQSPKIFDILASILPNFFIHNAVSKANIEFAINKALNEIKHSEQITVKLSQEDYSLLQQGKIALQECQNLKIEASDQVLLGGCLIETAEGIYDGRLELQLDKLKDILLSYKKQVVHGST